MSRHLPFLLLLLVLPLWLAASYGVRFALMEDGQWVGLCVEQTTRWECQARAGLGYLIHRLPIERLRLPRHTGG